MTAYVLVAKISPILDGSKLFIQLFFYEKRKTVELVYNKSVLFCWFLACLCYVIVAEVNHIPMIPVEKSLLLGGVQAFLSVKWSFSLVYFSRKHYKALDQARLLDWNDTTKRSILVKCIFLRFVSFIHIDIVPIKNMFIFR